MTFVDVLRDQAATSAGPAFEFAGPDGRVLASVGYPELDERARTIGAALADRGLAGQRVLVLLPPSGVAYVTALLGCLYAGAVAVPLPPLPATGPSRRHLAVLADADPAAAIVGPVAPAEQLVAAGVEVLSTVTLAAGRAAWHRPEIGPDTLAFLQYAPGPVRGVMVSHANLLASVTQLAARFGAGPLVSWLPPYHDMGLVSGILTPILTGSRVTLLPPSATPATWLRVIAERGARISGAPAAAYEQRVPADLTGLDLSGWEVAFTDAAVAPVALDQLGQVGLRPSAIFPCYWLPEATSLVAGRSAAVVTTFDVDTVAPGRLAKPRQDGTAIVDLGTPADGLEVAIVDPLTATRCADGTAGEVWVSGPNVAVGYLGRPDASERTFAARLRGSRENFLRTGALGFVHDGGLHVAERLDELVTL